MLTFQADAPMQKLVTGITYLPQGSDNIKTLPIPMVFKLVKSHRTTSKARRIPSGSLLINYLLTLTYTLFKKTATSALETL